MAEILGSALISSHGIKLSWADDRLRAVINDGAAQYVDDLLDCFDSWDGNGSLKAHCQRQFAKEMDICATCLANDALGRQFLALRRHLSVLLNDELDEGLRAIRQLYMEAATRAATIAKMLESTHAKMIVIKRRWRKGRHGRK